MRKLFTDTRIDFVGKRKLAYLITAAVFGFGLLLTLWRGFNYSVEFTGGTFLQVTTNAPADFATVREALSAQGVHGADIQSFGSENELVIRARTGKEGADVDNTTETVQAVANALNSSLGAGQYVIEHSAAVSPKVGGEMRDRAIIAILIAFVLVLIYLAYRFEWRFGLAAIGATAHDVLGTVIFIGAMNLEVSLVVVGAVLSVLGLSLNETIIIFDRIRENEKNKVTSDFDALINLSINETLPRTVITHGTSLSTMLTLVLFGGEVIRPFALVMFWGVGTGLFSSMFIAPALLRMIRRRWPIQKVAVRSRGSAARRASTA